MKLCDASIEYEQFEQGILSPFSRSNSDGFSNTSYETRRIPDITRSRFNDPQSGLSQKMNIHDSDSFQQADESEKNFDTLNQITIPNHGLPDRSQTKISTPEPRLRLKVRLRLSKRWRLIAKLAKDCPRKIFKRRPRSQFKTADRLREIKKVATGHTGINYQKVLQSVQDSVQNRCFVPTQTRAQQLAQRCEGRLRTALLPERVSGARWPSRVCSRADERKKVRLAQRQAAEERLSEEVRRTGTPQQKRVLGSDLSNTALGILQILPIESKSL